MQATAVKVVFDLLHVFGFEAFSLTNPAGSSTKTPEEDSQADVSNTHTHTHTLTVCSCFVFQITLVEEESQSGSQRTPSGGESGEVGEEGEEESEDGKDANKTTQRILSIMASFIEGEVSTYSILTHFYVHSLTGFAGQTQSVVLRGVAAEGIAKLLFSGRVLSLNLLTKLLLVWLDPSTQEDARLRAVLGLFFPAFAASDR